VGDSTATHVVAYYVCLICISCMQCISPISLRCGHDMGLPAHATISSRSLHAVCAISTVMRCWDQFSLHRWRYRFVLSVPTVNARTPVRFTTTHHYLLPTPIRRYSTVTFRGWFPARCAVSLLVYLLDWFSAAFCTGFVDSDSFHRALIG